MVKTMDSAVSTAFRTEQEQMQRYTGSSLKKPKVVMHVNEYVHPAERIPREFRKKDLDKWQAENEMRSNAQIKNHLDDLVDIFHSILGN